MTRFNYKSMKYTALYSSVLLLVGIWFVGWTIGAPINFREDLDHEEIVLFEDFESTVAGQIPNGWGTIQNASSPDFPKVMSVSEHIQPPSGKQVLKATRSPDEHLVSGFTYVDFEPLADRFVVSFWFYATGNMRGLNFSMNGATSGSGETSLANNAASTIFLTLHKSSNDVKVRLYNPTSMHPSKGKWTDTPNISVNTWHRLILDVDMKENTYDLFLNDETTPMIRRHPFVNATEAMTGLAFGYQSVSTESRDPAPMYVDDILISKGALKRSGDDNGSVNGDEGGTWRSQLYPEDWTPCTIDSVGRFLQDYSFAGYHAGTRPIPNSQTDLVIDVTQPPYFADSSGASDATAAIQQAIDFVGMAGGGTVYLPPGRFVLKAPEDQAYALGIRHSNVRLIGAGPDNTFIHLDSIMMRNKDAIRVYGEGNWTRPVGSTQRISEPLTYPTQIIPLEGNPLFNVGDWIFIAHDTTEAWIFEHQMGDLWPEGSIRGAGMYRQVIDVDREAGTITIDAPIRYYLLPRDHARVYRVGRHVEEIGIGHFSIGMTEHPGEIRASDDHTVPGTAGYDIHNSHAIRFTHTVNSWIQNVKSYRPEGNGRPHLLSNGILIDASRFITIDSVDLREPQYRGGGGNGYHFTLVGNDSLIVNSAAYNGRHNYDFKGGHANGNVISRSYAYSPDGLNSDFHMHLSPSNLIDLIVVDQDRFDAGWRGLSGTTPHGLSSTQVVFWNVRGERYKGNYREIIYSDQYGYGYVIGTQGPAHDVQLFGKESARTFPVDYTEGIGKGGSLAPQSLYEDQLARRMARHGVIHCPELDFRPPIPRISINSPGPKERVHGRIPISVDVEAPTEQAKITSVAIYIDDTVIYQGESISRDICIDTTNLSDGTHSVTVKATLSTGASTEMRTVFGVSNTWRFDDGFDPPIDGDWFGPVSRDKTMDLSPGWSHDASDPNSFFGDAGRRVRSEDTDEYLIWDADGLSEFAVTVYIQNSDDVNAISTLVLEEGVWRNIPFQVDVRESNAMGWKKAVLAGDVGSGIHAEQFKVEVRSGFAQGKEIQLGQLELSGWNR